jgi:hypothetical protein
MAGRAIIPSLWAAGVHCVIATIGTTQPASPLTNTEAIRNFGTRAGLKCAQEWLFGVPKRDVENLAPFLRLECQQLDDEDQMAKKRKRKYSRAAGTEVKREMHRYKRGKAKSGKGGKGGKVKSRKQAVAIALSKARKKGKKVPKKK